MGLLSLPDRKLFESLAAKHFNEGKYDELLAALEEREKKHAALGHVDKVKHTQQRLHWARAGVWEEVFEKQGPREVINLISSDEDEEVSSPRAGPSEPAARSPARPSARRRRSASPQIVDLTQAASDIDLRMKDGGGNDDEEDGEEGDDSASEENQPRAVSPELFGEGCGPLPTPPVSRSASHEPRKSKRAPRPSSFYGNLVAHPRYETGDAVPHFHQASPVKKQKNRSGKASPVKAKKEEKPIEPIFLTPEVATSVARLFPHTMFRSTISGAEIDAVIKADEAVLAAVRQDLVRWNEDKHRKKCSPVGNPTKYKLREDRVAGGNWVEMFARASVGDEIVEAGDYVAVAGEKDEPWFARVCYFHRHPHRSVLQVHLHWCTTSWAIHGKAAHPRHLLMRDICESVDAYTVVRKVEAKVGTNLTVPPSSFFISALHADNATSPVPVFEGSTPFCERLDIRPCWACEDRLQYAKFHGVDPKDKSAIPLPRWLPSSSSSVPSFRYDGHDYHIGDCVYLLAPKRAQEKPHWNGAQAAFRLAVLEAVDDWDGRDPYDLRPALKPSRLRVKPIVRFGHIVAAEPGKRRERDVVMTDETTSSVSVGDLMGTFSLKHGDAPSLEPYEHLDTFWASRQLAESLDADTENAILSVWATPPRLLQPHAKLKVNLEPLLLPLEKAALPSCAVCRKAQHEVEKDEKRYWASMADEDNRPVALSLYSGLDLLGLGLNAGCPELNLKFAIEFDANAAKACRDNHPGVKVFTSSVSDQLELAWKAREGGPVSGILDVDVVFGGPPCQEFSRANLHKRRDDPRPLQPFVFLGFLESGRPSFALAENVKEIATFRREENGDVFGLICDIALRLGYDVSAVALNASAFGVAQHRRRLFLSLTKRGLPRPALPEPTHAVSAKFTRIGRRYDDEVDESTRYAAATKRAAVHSGPFPAVTVGEALSDPALFPSFDGYENPVSTAEGLDTNGGTTHVVAGTGPKSEGRLRALGFHEKGQAGNWTDFADDPTIRLKKTPSWNNMAVDSWRRVWKDEISTPLLTKIAPQGSNGARIHFADNRCWSIAETLKLQGAPTTLQVFPKASKGKPLTKSDIELAYKLVGNAVAVPVAAAFGHELHKVLRTIVLGSKEPASPTFFFNLSRSHDVREGAAPAPAKKEVEVLVIDDEDEEDEEMIEPHDAASDDSQNSVEQLVDGEEDAEQDGPFRGAVLEVDDVDIEESSEDEVVILSSPKKRRKDVETDTDDEY